MEIEIIMQILPLWILMIIWLSLVVYISILSYYKIQVTTGNIRKQMKYIFYGMVLIFIGDSIHTIGFTYKAVTGNKNGTINIFGANFQLSSFSLWFDGTIFIIFYLIFEYFIITRYQDTELYTIDKWIIGMAITSIILILPGIIPNAFGIYTQEYIIAAYSPHEILFMIFGILVVFKLINHTQFTICKTDDEIIKEQEHYLQITGYSLIFSFLFFLLTLTHLPMSPLFGMFMIPKTIAYFISFYYLSKAIKIIH